MSFSEKVHSVSNRNRNQIARFGALSLNPFKANDKMGSQHPSPNVKTLSNFEPQIWPGIIISRDAQSVCFKWGRAKGAAKASCGETVIQKGVFGESVSSLPP